MPFEEEIDDDALAAARRELDAELHGNSLQSREFVYACELSAIPRDGQRGYAIPMEHDEIALFQLNGKIFATSNLCPHEMSPLLAAGSIDSEKMTVTCPLHGWTYEIPTGRLLGAGAVQTDLGCPLRTYSVKIVNDEVWVEEPLPYPQL